MLQQLELEMELQKQEALKQSEPSGEGSEHRDSFGELRLALQETLQQLEQINAWQPSIDEEQRQTLWMYLQAELANVKPDPICPKDWNWKGKGRPFKGKTTFVTGGRRTPWPLCVSSSSSLSFENNEPLVEAKAKPEM